VNLKRVLTTTMAVALGAALSSSAFATNGYFTHGVGTASKAMAGTGVGSNADMGAIMSASNPALAVFSGDQWEAGLSIFSPRRSYVASTQNFNGGLIPIDPANGVFLPSLSITPGEVDSDSEFFPIPYVAKNWSLQSGAKVTFAFYGNGGMNTDWDVSTGAEATSYFCGGNPFVGDPPATNPGPYCAGKAGVDLMQAFMKVNYSAKIGDNFSWGFGPIFAIQMFEANGIDSFAPITETFAASGGATSPTALNGNGHDTSTGFGFSTGLWWGISDSVSVGLSYQSEIYERVRRLRGPVCRARRL